jgi:thiol-disulfide isomerase/thioredoxin
MLPLGTPLPDFALPDVVTGRTVSSADCAAGRPLLVMFICAHCPYVLHLADALARLGTDYANKGLGIVAISSNDIATHPDDAPERLAAMSRDFGFVFPFCHDESQSVARAFTAACTPDFFLFGADRALVYRGQFDDTRPGCGRPDGRDLRAAMDATLAGRPVDQNQRPSTGCNIKWKPGNEPGNC